MPPQASGKEVEELVERREMSRLSRRQMLHAAGAVSRAVSLRRLKLNDEGPIARQDRRGDFAWALRLDSPFHASESLR